MKELSIEEKAKRYDEALKVLHKYDGANIMFSQSLKDEMFPELKESKEESEDDRIKKALIIFFQKFPYIDIEQAGTNAIAALAWIEKQGEQKPTEWSEEDETGLTNTIIMLKEGASLHFNKKDITKAVDWLKSLKERYTWKPNDEQITWLYRAADDASKDSRMKQVLNELLSDLKKLRGE